MYPGTILRSLLANGGSRIISSIYLSTEHYRFRATIGISNMDRQLAFKKYLERCSYSEHYFMDCSSGQEAFHNVLQFKLRNESHSEIRPLARLGDKQINSFFYAHCRQLASFLQSNEHFCNSLPFDCVKSRSTHTMGDYIEATYAQVANPGKVWFLLRLTSQLDATAMQNLALSRNKISWEDLVHSWVYDINYWN